MGGEDDVSEDDEAHRRREEGCRREEAIRGLLRRHDDKRLAIGAVEEIAQELGVSRSTMYRLITAYRAKGTVSSVEPRSKGRRKAAGLPAKAIGTEGSQSVRTLRVAHGQMHWLGQRVGLFGWNAKGPARGRRRGPFHNRARARARAD